MPLDVTDRASICAAIETAGAIDVLISSSGIGMVGAFEATPITHIPKA